MKVGINFLVEGRVGARMWEERDPTEGKIFEVLKMTW